MVLEVLKYVIVVVGIVAVAALILWGLVTLILNIVEPHENNQGTANNVQDRQITYEPQKLIAQEPREETYITEYVPENESMSDVDEQKALEEEQALTSGSPFGELTAEEEQFIKEKQRKIEERLAEKNAVVEEADDELDLDNIFIDDEDEQQAEDSQEEDDEDIEALINKILDGEADDETEEEQVEEQVQEPAKEEVEEEQVEEVEEPVEEEQEIEEVQEETAQEEKQDESEQKIKELEEMLARQKEEYEARLKEAETEKETLILENERIIKETENKANEKQVGPMLSLEEYEERLETLKERLKNNEKDLKPVKKEYVPLAKIKARLEKDNTKLRRKEALVAKQKVVLYGVNNYVDIDEEKAKKLAEDLDLLEGLRLSVQHCEEVMKANEERFPILETSYNSLMETNANIKADIEECMAKIAEIKATEVNEEE